MEGLLARRRCLDRERVVTMTAFLFRIRLVESIILFPPRWKGNRGRLWKCRRCNCDLTYRVFLRQRRTRNSPPKPSKAADVGSGIALKWAATCVPLRTEL